LGGSGSAGEDLGDFAGSGSASSCILQAQILQPPFEAVVDVQAIIPHAHLFSATLGDHDHLRPCAPESIHPSTDEAQNQSMLSPERHGSLCRLLEPQAYIDAKLVDTFCTLINNTAAELHRPRGLSPYLFAFPSGSLLSYRKRVKPDIGLVKEGTLDLSADSHHQLALHIHRNVCHVLSSS
jgi:hypothetical protein